MKKIEKAIKEIRKVYKGKNNFHKAYISSVKIKEDQIHIKLRKLIPQFTLGSPLYLPDEVNGVKVIYYGTKKLDKEYYKNLKDNGFDDEAAAFKKSHINKT